MGEGIFDLDIEGILAPQEGLGREPVGGVKCLALMLAV